MASEFSNQPPIGSFSDFITPTNNNLWQIFVNDLVCGSCAGLAYILTAHPLDSIKVRMQLERRPNITLRKIMRETYVNEGFRGFYKGMGSPLITIPAVNSIVFASYELAKRMMGVRLGEECTFK
jgi:hypothetical protein